MIIHLFCQTLTVIVHDMAVNIRDHIRLSMSGVALHRFDIAAADAELETCAAVPQAMKNDRFQVMLGNECLQFLSNLMFLIWSAVILSDYDIVILIFVS